MNDTYDINRIVIGKMYVCKQFGGKYVENKTNEYYLFYKSDNNYGKKIFKTEKVIEVFTEDEYEIYSGEKNTNNHIFNKPYIVDVEPIYPYLNEEELRTGAITKYRVIEIYNTINFKEKEKIRQLKLKQTIA